MKKHLALLLALFTALILTACGQSEPESSAAAASTAEPDGKATAVVPVFAPGSASSTLQGDMEQSSLEIVWEQDGKSRICTTPTINGLGPEESTAPEILPFDHIMGHTGFMECHRKAGTSWEERFYYAMDFHGNDAPVCIGESCGYEADDVLIDLDGDGVEELICNSTYTELTSRFVTVYRDAEGKVMKSTVDLSQMVGDAPELAAFLVSDNLSYYDSSQECFRFSYRDENGDWLEREAAWPEAFTEKEYQLEERFFQYQ